MLKTTYIIGKGPSLDNLTLDDFKAQGHILCINDSIKKLQELKIGAFTVQMDYEIGEIVNIKQPIVIAKRVWDFGLYRNHKFVCVINTDNGNSFDLDPSCITTTLAIKYAQLHLQTEFIMLYCFDALLNGNCEYANCIGYPSDKYHANKQRFIRQRDEIEKALGTMPHYWRPP